MDNNIKTRSWPCLRPDSMTSVQLFIFMKPDLLLFLLTDYKESLRKGGGGSEKAGDKIRSLDMLSTWDIGEYRGQRSFMAK